MSDPHYTAAFRILVVDDEEPARHGLKRLLQRNDLVIDLASSGEDALRQIDERSKDYHVVLTDYKMPGLDGKAVLERLLVTSPLTKVIVVTGKGSTVSAVECMKLGAYDYIEKPFDIVLIRAAVERALRESRLAEDNLLLRKAQALKGRGDLILVWEDPAMEKAVLLAQKLALTNDSVVIEGESGTGKELLARMIHQCSMRRNRPFMALNCGAFSEELLVSELFGYEKGSFTGAVEAKKGLLEAVDGGTLFLDEIGELPASMQVRFLRALEQKEVLRVGARAAIPVEFRVVAASNRNLQKMFESGEFRRDLYYRLCVHPLMIPALRNRPADIPVLFEHFNRMLEREGQATAQGLSPAVVKLLLRYSWPGNVRELGSLVRQLAVSCPGRVADPSDLPPQYTAMQESTAAADGAVGQPVDLESLKLEHIRQVLEKTEGNRTQAARLLGISRVGLQRFLLRHPELTRIGRDGGRGEDS